MSAPKTMMAAVCNGAGAPLVLEQVSVPQPSPEQYLVRLESCGVCHSDLHLRDGDEQLSQDLYPLVFGHEGIGRIVAGDGPLEIGTRVGLPWLYGSCLSCEPCLTGEENYCSRQQVRGVEFDGAFADFAVVDKQFACPIPSGIDPVSGAPLLCAGLTAWSAIKRTRFRPGCRVLIVGAGGLGQYAVLIAVACGARVIVIDQDTAKLETAAQLGAESCFRAGPDAGRLVRESGGADVVLNFAPTPQVWATIEMAVNPISDIVVVALVHDPVPLSMMWLIDGGHRLLGSSVGTRAELSEFLQFAAHRELPVPVEAIPLVDANVALDRLAAGDVVGRLCIDFSL